MDWISVILFLALVPTVLILAELVFRSGLWLYDLLYVETVSRADYIDEAYHPYLDWIESWKSQMFFYLPIGLRLHNNDNQDSPTLASTNTHGFRCREFSRPNKNVLTIALLGGSTAWGCGATSNATNISGHLETIINQDKRLLRGRYDHAEVYNLAQVNGTQTQDIINVNFFFKDINPAIVISLTGWNELVVTDQYNQFLLERFRLYYLEELVDWRSPNVEGQRAQLIRHHFFEWLISKSALFREIAKLRRASVESSVSPFGDIRDRIDLAREIFLEHLEQLQRLGTAHNFVHFQFMQPHLYRKKFLTEQEKKIVELYDVVRPMHGGQVIGDYLRDHDIYNPIIQHTTPESTRYGHVSNLVDIFREEKEDIYFTLVHMRENGYRRIAKSIYNTIVSSAENE